MFHSGQLIVSTGLRELDGNCFALLNCAEILGGGYTVGTLNLIEEDRDTEYYKCLFQYFIAEGLASEQEVGIINADSAKTTTFLENIPSPKISSSSATTDTAASTVSYIHCINLFFAGTKNENCVAI